ncbi:Probable RNA-directed DNA polymerase from transposon BS [Eumeta japonica]|uniref:Probable RNA-directed DNA polymerase from transposon BS n=1 Tax=Eumeta variegata TaxID=151549 RepID=A0A4C1U0N2_EUMVA|nr:Probable RNA-directed DNA polymerase from transposon BS [Eumeta japonica]
MAQLLKGNPDDPAAYRPIALSSVLAKIAEYLVKNRLEWITESRGLLSNAQYGFRKRRSTTDSLCIFTSDIRVSFFQGKFVTAAFLDVSSANDNVQLPILRNKFHKLKMPVRLSNFIFYVLSERRILFRIGELSISPCKILQYADDLLLYFSDTSVFNSASILSESLLALQLHLHSLGLEFSASKNNLVFSQGRERCRMCLLSLGMSGFPVKVY